MRRFIAEQLDHPKATVRVDAIEALGNLEDPRALPLLENYPVEPNDRPENKAAAAAIVRINAGKPQAKEVGDLREEVLDLEKELRDLKKKLDTLDKKVTPKKPAPDKK